MDRAAPPGAGKSAQAGAAHQHLHRSVTDLDSKAEGEFGVHALAAVGAS